MQPRSQRSLRFLFFVKKRREESHRITKSESEGNAGIEVGY